MSYTIVWKGNQHTNSSSRQGRKPFVIVNHISAGSMSSMDSWFTTPNNSVSSAHFGISKTGQIHQYVDIQRMAWGNGTRINDLPTNYAKVLGDVGIGVNANLYSVSIEHEGMDGNLTEPQFQTSVWLHKWIRDEIIRLYGQEAKFDLDDYHVLGHFQLSRGKPLCPGKLFPWTRLYEALKSSEGDENVELKKEIIALKDEVAELKKNIVDLEERSKLDDVPDWATKPVLAAVNAGLVDTPNGGSHDFYRIITILHRAGLIKNQSTLE